MRVDLYNQSGTKLNLLANQISALDQPSRNLVTVELGLTRLILQLIVLFFRYQEGLRLFVSLSVRFRVNFTGCPRIVT